LTQTNNNATIAGNKGSDTFNISGYATGLNTGTYSEILSVSSSALTNYNVTINNGSLVIGKATLTISAVADTKTYDGTRTSNVVPTFTGLVSADTGKLTGLAQAFDSVNVNGVNGSILSVSNYSLNSNNYNVITHTATGTINQLAEVTYTGVSGGNWSDPANWGSGSTAGAIPTLNNVATVIIPSGKTVIYNKDQPNSLTTTSNVSNNGTIKFVTTIDLDYSGIISGGSVFKQGSGIFKLSSKYNKIDFINFSENFTINSSCSNNDCGTYGNISGTGNLTIINGGIFLGNIYLTGNLTLGKNDGTSLENQLITFGTRNYPNIVTVTGDINAYASLNLASTITSGRDQTYNAPITLIRDTVITSTNGSITFKNTIDSDDPKDTKYFKADAYVDLNLEGKIGSINPLWSMDAE
ncbi:MAG: hypothetical protein EBV81_04990, partial [Proteobacteria bacterium]|nr:hypothetical protein [Candidatus Fonsibacter sp. PEL5]